MDCQGLKPALIPDGYAALKRRSSTALYAYPHIYIAQCGNANYCNAACCLSQAS
jgi:hypothetical protein